MQDPIIHRDTENIQSNSLKNWTEVVEWTRVNDPKWPEYIPLAEGQLLPEVITGYYIQTDQEIVNIQSNIVLPSWLRAYNESWGNTYVEYMTWRLTPIPEVSRDQQALIYKSFWSLFVWFGLFMSFGFMVVFLFRLLSFKWTK